MATIEYGDISPHTAGYAMRDLLKRGQPGLLLDKFGTAKDLPAKVHPDYEWLDDIQDALFLCDAERCGQCTNRVQASDPLGQRSCPLGDVHTIDEALWYRCAKYKGRIIDSMVGEHMAQHEVDNPPETLKFRRYGFETLKPGYSAGITSAGS